MNDFSLLVRNISSVHQHLQKQAVSAVNQSLTIRNWLIGHYIVEYEQNGKDRAKYGKKILLKLAKELNQLKGLEERSLRRFRKFYLSYPQLGITLKKNEIVQTLSALSGKKVLPLSSKIEKVSIRGTASPKFEALRNIDGKFLLSKLSYSHIEQLIRIDDPLKRTFYEIECIKATWSVRELKRQISSLYFERSGLSKNPEKLSTLINQQLKPSKVTDIIKNVYAFEFLDLKSKEFIEESDLETALLDHLQTFIIELGNGFCFEGRQKRILIGKSYYFIDLVFYHRILKCHILIELKIGPFEHSDIGQLNTFINFFKEEISEENDNHPVGILLVAEKDQALVKYATAGMDENLFVQQYLVQLPSKEQLEKYIDSELRKLKS